MDLKSSDWMLIEGALVTQINTFNVVDLDSGDTGPELAEIIRRMMWRTGELLVMVNDKNAAGIE